MGSLVLCHKTKAKRPYEIARIHRKIYTVEELCFYLRNNFYLVDYTIMNTSLCEWLEQELGLFSLGEALRVEIAGLCQTENFVMTILRASGIYSSGELLYIEETFRNLKEQKDVERQKQKADNLFQSGEIEEAIRVYQRILRESWDDSVEISLYGRIYACLGSAYGARFLYEEAAVLLKRAYTMCEDEHMLWAYIYACYCYMTPERYKSLIESEPKYERIDASIQKEISEIRSTSKDPFSVKRLQKWKEDYKRS
jgi:tetratricopeptide (TPR) repeat protein